MEAPGAFDARIRHNSSSLSDRSLILQSKTVGIVSNRDSSFTFQFRYTIFVRLARSESRGPKSLTTLLRLKLGHWSTRTNRVITASTCASVLDSGFHLRARGALFVDPRRRGGLKSNCHYSRCQPGKSQPGRTFPSMLSHCTAGLVAMDMYYYSAKCCSRIGYARFG